MTFAWCKALYRGAAQHPKRTLAVAISVVLSFASGIFRLQLRTDGQALVSQTAPEVRSDAEIRAHFGVGDQIVVLIHTPDTNGIFNPATLQLIRSLTEEFKRIPGVTAANVMSLATERNFRLRPNTLSFQTLLEPPLVTPAELSLLKNDLLRLDLYTGTLISFDGKSAVILLAVPDAINRAEFYRDISRIVASQKSAANEIAVTGAPVAESLFGIQILRDLGVPRLVLGATAGIDGSSEDWRIPRSVHQLRVFVAKHIGLMPLAVLVMMLVLLVCFRNLPAAVLPLPGVAATLLIVFGLMGWLGVPIYLTTAVMPLLLTVISVTNDIYLFSRYVALLREHPGRNHIELIEEAFGKLTRPIVVTSLAATIGFWSFGFSPLKAVQSFGWFAGIGALFGLLISLTVVPALLALIRPQRLVCERETETSSVATLLGSWFGRMGELIVRNRGLVIGGAVVALAIAPFGLRRVVVQDSWTSGFDPESEFRRVTEQVNKNFLGMHLLQISAEAAQTLVAEIPATAINPPNIALPGSLLNEPICIAGNTLTLTDAYSSKVLRLRIEAATREGDQIIARLAFDETGRSILNSLTNAAGFRVAIPVRTQCQPEVMRAIGDLESFIRSRRQYAVGGVLGPLDYLETIRFMARGGDAQARALPDNAVETKLLWDFYASVLGQQRLHQIVDPDYSASLTTVFLKDANFVDTAKLMRDIRDFERDHLSAKGIKLTFAGDVAVSQSLIRDIVSTQMQSLLWSTIGIFFVVALLARSWQWGFYCLLPSLLAVAVKFAGMGWMNIPLGVATSMFAAMTLGLGANCAIHLMEGFTVARQLGKASREAVTLSLRQTGPAALVNTLAVSLGFGVLMLSQVPANARLGILLVLGMVNCAIASLLLLPALLSREE